MKTTTLSILFLLFTLFHSQAQDTFSIVAVDTLTGEVGSAGASCVNMNNFPGYATDFLGELFPGVGAINTQASYTTANQANARARMNAGDSPEQIIQWLVDNDATGNPSVRQYGIVRLVNGTSLSAGYTGINCLDYKNHIVGKNYCIQGNILLGQSILDSMEARFNRADGDLACKLMAALQGANVPGADTRCANNGTSSLFAFVKVSTPNDVFGSPSFKLSVKTVDNARIEPIDSLQKLFDATRSCLATGLGNTGKQGSKLFLYPNPTNDMVNVGVANEEILSVKVFTSTGRLVMESFEAVFSISELPAGLYNLQVQTKESLYNGRVLKK